MGIDETIFADTLLGSLRAWEPSEQSITSVHTLLPKQADLAQLGTRVQRLLPTGIEHLYQGSLDFFGRIIR